MTVFDVLQIQQISAELGILPNMVQPVRNYNTQVECNKLMDILILRALRQILRYSQVKPSHTMQGL